MKGKMIGRGRMSEVYAWGDEQVLKLFYEGHSSTYVENEAILSRIAHEAKIATPSIGDDVIEVDGRYGILANSWNLNIGRYKRETMDTDWRCSHFGRTACPHASRSST